MRLVPKLFLALLSLPLFTGVASATDKSKVIFDRLCAQCHAPKGEGMKNIAAPAIAGLPEWYVTAQLKKFREGIRGEHPGDAAGTRMAPMARFLRKDEDLDAVAKYVAAMPVQAQPATIEGGSIVRGEQRYQVCAACHGADGMGIQDTQGPRLAGQNDWYLLTQLKNFKSGARGGDAARDPMGAAMRGNALAMDDQAMLDLIAYINMLAPTPQAAGKPTP